MAAKESPGSGIDSPFTISGPDEKRRFMDFLLESMPDQIYFKDRESRFTCVSRAVAEHLGKSDPRELIGKTDFDFFDEQTARVAFDDEQIIIATGRPVLGKVERGTHSDGHYSWSLTTKLPLHDASGAIIGIGGISKDITAIKEMEAQLVKANGELASRQQALEEANAQLKTAQAQLIEAEKAQLTARLAFGVAHEIRNPLNILNMGIEFLSADPVVSQAVGSTGILKELVDAINRAESVVARLMECSQPEHIETLRQSPPRAPGQV